MPGYASKSVQGGGTRRGPRRRALLLALLAALSHGRELVAADSGYPHGTPPSRVEILHPQELQTTIQTVGFRYYGNHPPRPRTTPSCRHHPGPDRAGPDVIQPIHPLSPPHPPWAPCPPQTAHHPTDFAGPLEGEVRNATALFMSGEEACRESPMLPGMIVFILDHFPCGFAGV